MQEKDLKILLDEWSNHSGFIQPTLGRKKTTNNYKQTNPSPFGWFFSFIHCNMVNGCSKYPIAQKLGRLEEELFCTCPVYHLPPATPFTHHIERLDVILCGPSLWSRMEVPMRFSAEWGKTLVAKNSFYSLCQTISVKISKPWNFIYGYIKRGTSCHIMFNFLHSTKLRSKRNNLDFQNALNY